MLSGLVFDVGLSLSLELTNERGAGMKVRFFTDLPQLSIAVPAAGLKQGCQYQ